MTNKPMAASRAPTPVIVHSRRILLAGGIVVSRDDGATAIDLRIPGATISLEEAQRRELVEALEAIVREGSLR